MQPAAATFFSTVELVELLSTFMSSKALARLSTTSAALDSVCSPILWRNVTFQSWQYDKHKELHAERFKGLAQREHYVRTLKMDADSFILYTNGMSEPTNTLSSSPSRPDWVPVPNPQLSFKEVCFSPMTRLTRLECCLCPNEYYSPDQIPGVEIFNNSNLVPQFCWMLELNPRLVHLTLTWLQFKSTLDRSLLVRSIGGLSELKHLHIASRGSNERSFESMATIFSCLPTSLMTLVLRAGCSSEITPEESEPNPVMKTVVPRDGPLLCLKELELPIHKVTPESEYGRILEHCPNMNTLRLRPMHRESALTIKEIAPLIKRHCPLIRSIKATREIIWWHDWNPFDILDGVESNLESLHFDSYNPYFDNKCESHSISSFQYHSGTLRDVRLTGCLSLSNEVMQSIVTTCALLERLEISGRSDNRAVAKLPDIVAHNWVCTGLKHLEMTVDWGRFEDPTPKHLPAYYLRHSSSPPLDQDQERWGMLERLYRQIGSLVELEVLNLCAFINRMLINRYEPVDPDRPRQFICGGVLDKSFRSQDRFPLLLSLGDYGGRQGYLSWLSGLKNLKELRGSVHLGNPEVAMTLKQNEVEWMVEHWPKLQVLELLPNQEEAPAHIDVDGYAHVNWLLRRKPTLDLRRRWDSPKASWDGLWTQVELDELMMAKHEN